MSYRHSRRWMLGITPLIVALATALAVGCDRAPTDTTALPDAPPSAAIPPDRGQLERVARRVAKALADPAFRRELKAALDRSPVVEQKLHFQRFLYTADRQALRRLAQLNHEPEDAVAREVASAVTLEMYFPVPSHRRHWNGGESILVATAIADDDAPVAFDIHGGRHILSATTPPATPVLAVVPAETDFDHPVPSALVSCTAMRISADCTSGPTSTTPTAAIPGLYMSRSHLAGTFESWLKGAPEIEILVLGQKGTSDSLTRYQCIGQRASGSYYFDQNATDWQGSVLLFSQTQLDNYRQQHPGQALRILFMEDDDTSCELRTENTAIQKLLGSVDEITRGLAGGKDTTTSVGQRLYKYASAAQKIYSVIASLFKTNDDLIGTAVESAVTGELYTGYNWVLKTENGGTNGYVNLRMQ